MNEDDKEEVEKVVKDKKSKKSKSAKKKKKRAKESTASTGASDIPKASEETLGESEQDTVNRTEPRRPTETSETAESFLEEKERIANRSTMAKTTVVHSSASASIDRLEEGGFGEAKNEKKDSKRDKKKSKKKSSKSGSSAAASASDSVASRRPAPSSSIVEEKQRLAGRREESVESSAVEASPRVSSQTTTISSVTEAKLQIAERSSQRSSATSGRTGRTTLSSQTSVATSESTPGARPVQSSFAGSTSSSPDEESALPSLDETAAATATATTASSTGPALSHDHLVSAVLVEEGVASDDGKPLVVAQAIPMQEEKPLWKSRRFLIGLLFVVILAIVLGVAIPLSTNNELGPVTSPPTPQDTTTSSLGTTITPTSASSKAALPTIQPTFLPTSAPTTFKFFQQSSSTCGAFVSIGSDPGAILLSELSGCPLRTDPCVDSVSLPFGIRWLDGTEIFDIAITNGFRLYMGWSTGGLACDLGSNGRIVNVLYNEDNVFDTFGVSSNVYFLNTGSSVIVSWENLDVKPGCCGSAQVELWPNGDIEMRWGNLGGSVIPVIVKAGIEDRSDGGDGVVYPALGPAFGSDGVSSFSTSESGPSGLCESFESIYRQYSESSVGCETFVKLSDNPDATLVLKDSNCTRDALGSPDCPEEVILPFDFPWFSDTLIRSVVVGNTGQIHMDGEWYPRGNDGAGLPVEVGGASPGPRIAVASEDRINLWVDVYTLEKAESFIISWESETSGSGDLIVNAQAELFSNGDIELRWGPSAETRLYALSISAGIEDNSRPVPEAYPVTGFPFDGETGVVSSNAFPSSQCRRFTANYEYMSKAPSPAPSPSPTVRIEDGAPTFSPTVGCITFLSNF